MSEALLPSIVALLAIAAMVLHAILLARFVKKIDKLGVLSFEESDALNQLVLSGSGGIRVQFRALVYLLARKYAVAKDTSIVEAGDHARLSFLLAMLLIIAWGSVVMIFK